MAFSAAVLVANRNPLAATVVVVGRTAEALDHEEVAWADPEVVK